MAIRVDFKHNGNFEAIHLTGHIKTRRVLKQVIDRMKMLYEADMWNKDTDDDDNE